MAARRGAVTFSERCEQMDEAQLEMHKSMITWKMVPIKGAWEVENEKGDMVDSPEVKEAKASLKTFKKEQSKHWSEIAHSDKGVYIGYCRAGELIAEAVKETSEYYNLNVTLAADYILGRNWSECH